MEQIEQSLIHSVKNARNSILYKQKLEHFPCESMDDFTKLPFTHKQELRDAFPYGGLAVPMAEVIEAHMSSATSGLPALSFLTKKDILESKIAISEAWKSFGVTRDTKLMFAMSYGLFSGAPINTYAIQHIGAFVLPAGIISMSRYYDYIDQFSIDFVVATPGFYYYLYEYCLQNNIDPRKTSLRKAVAAGEVYSDDTKKEISEMFNIQVFDHYGLAEVNTGILYECPPGQVMHSLESYVYSEVVDVITEQQVPVGATGELVFTTLKKDASPVIRYKTGDLVQYHGYVDCPCGKSGFMCGRIKSRRDSIVSIKGIKIDPFELRDKIMKVLAYQKIPESYFTFVLKQNKVNYTPRLRMANISTLDARLVESLLKELTAITFQVEIMPISHWFNGKIKSKIIEYED